MTHHEFRTYSLPIAVAAAGALIGLSIYLGAREIAQSGVVSVGGAQKTAEAQVKKPAPITPQDHIRGSSSAKVVIFEYSDLECPFCKTFHSTLKSVMSKYPPTDVAWVYRHHPLPIHDRAPKEAEAAECAAEQGGNTSFWAYVDRIFEVSPTNNGLAPSELPKIAAHIGINVPAFEKCLSSGKYAAKVSAQSKEAASIGVTGTPHSFLVGPNGYLVSLKGALSEAAVRTKIDEALKGK